MSYIDREATVKALNRLCDRVCQYSKAQRFTMCGACPLGDAFIVIEYDIPDADVEPIRHGEWIMKPDPYGFFGEIPVCSVCGCTTKMRETYNYCPNCFAKMDMGEDNT